MLVVNELDYIWNLYLVSTVATADEKIEISIHGIAQPPIQNDLQIETLQIGTFKLVDLKSQSVDQEIESKLDLSH